MPIVSALSELEHATREGYAVPHFDVWDSTTTDGALAALIEKRAPGIIAVYSGVFNGPTARGLAAYIRARAEDAPVPVAILLDHGTSLEQCVQAIRYGCTDVMFDGSRLPLEENLAQTRRIVGAAHAAGVCVEAELGHVGQAGDLDDHAGQRAGLTDPTEAARFVRETSVDYLAVAIGTAHGVYRGEPHLDLDLLREIRRRVDVPLVLHGGTGLAGAPLRAAIAGGIAKINVSTDLFNSAGRRVAEASWVPVEAPWAEDPTFFEATATIADAFRERCLYYIDLFGAAGRA
jgi:fructose-bisphosphate aldolase, class II